MSDNTITIYQPDECITLVHREKQFVLTLTESQHALSRLNEIKTTSPDSYPELIGVFTAGYYELVKALGHLKTELMYIEHELDLWRAKLLTDSDKIPKLLSELGLKDTAEVKNALIIKNKDYSELCLIKGEFEVNIEKVEAKIRVLTSASFSIKEIATMKGSTHYKNHQDYSIPEGASSGTTMRRKFTSEF